MKNRLLASCILIAWILLLIKIMVLKDLPVIRVGGLMFHFGGTHEGAPNWIPFKTIVPYLRGDRGLLIAALNLAGNIFLLVPIGLLSAFIVGNMNWKKSLALALAAGFTIEAMQLLLHVGIFDIDDIILNALGVMIGYWTYKMFEKKMHAEKYKKAILVAVIMLVIAASGSLYGFVMYQEHHPQLDVRRGFQNNPGDSIDNNDASIRQGADPCGGTGGTGQIVDVANNSITIKRRDGTQIIINFTNQTTFRNAAGVTSKSDLKMGDRVTVVVISNHVATTVLVCNEANAEVVK